MKAKPVTSARQGVGEREMNAGEAPVIGMTDTFYTPGTYQLDVRTYSRHQCCVAMFPLCGARVM